MTRLFLAIEVKAGPDVRRRLRPPGRSDACARTPPNRLPIYSTCRARISSRSLIAATCRADELALDVAFDSPTCSSIETSRAPVAAGPSSVWPRRLRSWGSIDRRCPRRQCSVPGETPRSVPSSGARRALPRSMERGDPRRALRQLEDGPAGSAACLPRSNPMSSPARRLSRARPARLRHRVRVDRPRSTRARAFPSRSGRGSRSVQQ